MRGLDGRHPATNGQKILEPAPGFQEKLERQGQILTERVADLKEAMRKGSEAIGVGLRRSSSRCSSATLPDPFSDERKKRIGGLSIRQESMIRELSGQKVSVQEITRRRVAR